MLEVSFKKARIMKHWAARIGAEIQVDASRAAELGYAQKGTTMTLIQRFFSTVLPRKQADAMRAESQAWRIRCCSCGASRSVWDAGGIRWNAASTGKRTLVHCSHCGGRRTAAIERVPAAA